MKALIQIILLGVLAMSPRVARACEGPVGGGEGNCAPDFTLPALDGKQIRLSAYRGKVIVLNFWATWCEPCVVEMPALESLNRSASRLGAVLLAASINEDGKKEIPDFFSTKLKGRTPSFPVLLDGGEKVSHRYGTFKVPETYIIDKKGRIRDKIIGLRDWDDSVLVHYLEMLAHE